MTWTKAVVGRRCRFVHRVRLWAGARLGRPARPGSIRPGRPDPKGQRGPPARHLAAKIPIFCLFEIWDGIGSPGWRSGMRGRAICTKLQWVKFFVVPIEYSCFKHEKLWVIYLRNLFLKSVLISTFPKLILKLAQRKYSFFYSLRECLLSRLPYLKCIRLGSVCSSCLSFKMH